MPSPERGGNMLFRIARKAKENAKSGSVVLMQFARKSGKRANKLLLFAGKVRLLACPQVALLRGRTTQQPQQEVPLVRACWRPTAPSSNECLLLPPPRSGRPTGGGGEAAAP